MTIFVDTSAFYALMSEKDEEHVRAVVKWNSLLDDQYALLVTSNYVVVETNALLRNRLGMKLAREFTREVLPAVTLFWITEAIHNAAMEAVLATGTAGPSLIDHTSFLVMQENRITQAFAFDDHFRKQGY